MTSKHCAKYKKSVTKNHIFKNTIYMNCLKCKSVVRSHLRRYTRKGKGNRSDENVKNGCDYGCTTLYSCKN